jgi:hypothetical protein
MLPTSVKRHHYEKEEKRNINMTRKPTLNPTLFFYFSPTAYFLTTILAPRTNGSFVFAPTYEANPAQNQKNHFIDTFSYICIP